MDDKLAIVIEMFASLPRFVQRPRINPLRNLRRFDSVNLPTSAISCTAKTITRGPTSSTQAMCTGHSGLRAQVLRISAQAKTDERSE